MINDNVYVRKFSWIYNGISNPTLIAIKDCDRVLNIENHSEKILLNFLLKAKKKKKKKKKNEFGFSDA